MNIKKVREIFERLQSQYPNPKIELDFHNTFELLVAVVLSAQSTDKSVNKAAIPLFKIANTPKKMLALGEEGLKEYIKTIGLYNGKAKNLIKTCHILADKFHSKIPDNAKELESLPGVGHKSANVILNVAFDQPTIAVDTHVFRVSNRTHLAQGKDVKAVESQLEQIIPQAFKQNASRWLILLGRYTCLARKPKCQTCIIRNLCEYEDKL